LSSSRKTPNHTKGLLHPRNLHRAPYDFSQLVERTPELGSFVVPHPGGGKTIDFADPLAVKSLNRALLRLHYGLEHWDLPAGYLCPPIPSRADYLHHVADLLASDRNGVIPRGREIRVLDIGMGANAIYLLLGPPTYGWSMVGTEVDRGSLEWARQLIAANPGLAASIECRLQPNRDAILENVTKPGELSLSLSAIRPSTPRRRKRPPARSAN
jgi:23S rRNA (adenine1618-N6)-methyltransferase